MTEAAELRVGRISYRNVLPVYHPLESGVVPHAMSFVHGPPAELNRRMQTGELDLASISSIEYARRPHKYMLLPDLAIGSRGPVQSVLLLSRVPVSELGGERILVSAETHTSAMLLALLLRRLWRVPATLVAGAGSATDALQCNDAPPAAVLAIGDEALLLRSCAAFAQRIDLGQVWYEWTGLPFVFGVWAMRRSLPQEQPEAARRACADFLAAKAWGRANLESLLPLAGAGFGLGRDELRRYFQGLSYDLGPREQKGLQRFFQELQAASLLDAAPRLEFAPLDKAGAHA